MNRSQPRVESAALRLQAGETVEVLSKEEIFATLDPNGALDGQLFMPEMLQYCGRRFRVASRVTKTCDTTTNSSLRRMKDTIHLGDLRCTGAAHGGCEARCLLFWKEAWLKRTSSAEAKVSEQRSGPRRPPAVTEETLLSATRRKNVENGDEVFVCQATNLPVASTPIRWWDLTHYMQDISCGNQTIGQVARAIAYRIFNRTLRVKGYRAQIWLFNRIQRLRGQHPYPEILGGAAGTTPKALLGLVAGERVEVKSLEDICATINADGKNRGLFFDIEMTPYCGGTYTVDRRVTRIVDERSGRLIQLPGDCIALDGVICHGIYHSGCPRKIPSYWREIWLRRADTTPTSMSNAGGIDA